MAGVPGFEPGLSVLETDVLTVDTIPLRVLPITDCRLKPDLRFNLAIGNCQSAIASLRLFVTRVFAATATEFAEFQPIGRGLLILGRHVVPALAIVTLKHNVIAWHVLISNFRLPIADR